MKNADMPAQAVSTGSSINALDWQIANAIQWLDADDHTHVADDMRDARAKVAALVEALAKLHEASDDSDGACYGTLSTSFVRDICADALRAAGVVL